MSKVGAPDMLVAAETLVADVIARWRNGEAPDAGAILDEHPELAATHDLAMELIYEEFILRAEAGAPPDERSLARRFPGFAPSIRKMVQTFREVTRESVPRPRPESTQWPKPGASFLGFTLLSELGRGSFARVFLARDPAVGDRLVAVKVAPTGGDEAHILGRLRHPNIVPVYSVREDPTTGLRLVCMEYRGSATLWDVLDEAFDRPGFPTHARVILEAGRQGAGTADAEPPSADPAPILRHGTYVQGVVHLAIQMADALDYTHHRGICHRDLKPSNVIVDPAGQPLLLDFNLSTDGRQPEDKVAGTVPYMAPEQLRVLFAHATDPTDIDARADLYSLGVIIYQLLTGTHPFGPLPLCDSLAEQAAKLLECQAKGPQPVRRCNPSVDRRTARAVEQCLAMNPADRPRSARELAAALRRCLSPWHRARSWARRHPWVVGGVGLLLLAILGATGFHLATRPPFADRQVRLAWTEYRAGRYRDAVEHFSQALQVAPDHAEASYGRGRAYLLMGDHAAALDDFGRASRLAPDGRTAACRAYCLTAMRSCPEAVIRYDEAIARGYENAPVHNNLGYCYLQRAEGLDVAMRHLDRALQLDPALQSAYHNRLKLHYRFWLKHRGTLPSGWRADIDQAFALGPMSVELHYDAACLFAVAAREDPSLIEPALRHLRTTIGHKPYDERWRFEPAFDALVEVNPQLIPIHPPTPLPVNGTRFVDPAPAGTR